MPQSKCITGLGKVVTKITADVYEALELMNAWRDVYIALLKVTKSKEEAKEALMFLVKIEGEK